MKSAEGSGGREKESGAGRSTRTWRHARTLLLLDHSDSGAVQPRPASNPLREGGSFAGLDRGQEIKVPLPMGNERRIGNPCLPGRGRPWEQG